MVFEVVFFYLKILSVVFVIMMIERKVSGFDRVVVWN